MINGITEVQKKKLRQLWFIFGNNGSKCILGNHKFIQGILERNEDNREFYQQGKAVLTKD